MKSKIRRSPLFYVGDKYKLMHQLLPYFPARIRNFYEPFSGGGTVFLNLEAENYFLNDINEYLVEIHKYLISNSVNPGSFLRKAGKIIEEYGLSRSYKEDVVPEMLKLNFKKTYYAEFNKTGYYNLRERVNRTRRKDPLLLYILLIYGFNRMLRFNGEGKFNLPVGNVDFNKNVESALSGYFAFVRERSIEIFSKDFKEFLSDNMDDFSEGDFVYADPPYLITSSEYNKLWNEESELCLLSLLDKLNSKNVRFALSNVTRYNGSRNKVLEDWAKKYCVRRIKSNYISYHDNGRKKIEEILVKNYH